MKRLRAEEEIDSAEEVDPEELETGVVVGGVGVVVGGVVVVAGSGFSGEEVSGFSVGGVSSATTISAALDENVA